MDKPTNFFKDVLWKRASKFFEEKDWKNSLRYYFVYFNSFHKFTEYKSNNSEMTKEEYIGFFNYIETIFELSRNLNSIEFVDFEDIEDAYDFFMQQQTHLDKMMLDEDFPFDKYFQNYIFIGISAIAFKRYLYAESIFEDGLSKAKEKERDYNIVLELLFLKADALEKQEKYKKALKEIECGITILEIEKKPMSDPQLFSYTNLQSRYNKKLEYLNRKISEGGMSSSLPPELPRCITYHDHVFKYFYNGKKYYEYICIAGYDKHKKTNPIRCKAKIGIPKMFTGNENNETSIFVINPEHICSQENPVVRIITNAALKKMMEDIFKSTNPRPTRSEMLLRLYKKIEDETPKGQEKQKIDEKLVKSFYFDLEKTYKKDDCDFKTDTKCPPSRLELFKLRTYTGDESRSLIICYSSKFQQNSIRDSSYVFIDGTFDIAPEGFAQVLVMMGQTSVMNMPLAYILLPNKNQSSYEKAFLMFKSTVKSNFRPGTTFICDFEKGLHNAIKNCLMSKGHYFQFCYFHFTQCMKRHFDKYEKTDLTLELHKIANILPFISEELLSNVIDELYEYEETKKFAEYFEKNFYHIYKYEDWSVFLKPEKETISNNVAESHNNLLSRIIGYRPSLMKFETKISEIEENYYAKKTYHTFTAPIITRINEEVFIQKYKEFISKIRRASKDKHSFADEAQHIEFEDENEDETEKEILNKNTIVENESSVQKSSMKNVKSGQAPNIKNLPESAFKILMAFLGKFKNSVPRSKERGEILKDATTAIQAFEPLLTKEKIREWFFNNIDKKI